VEILAGRIEPGKLLSMQSTDFCQQICPRSVQKAGCGAKKSKFLSAIPISSSSQDPC
jgi:hypothetical protein